MESIFITINSIKPYTQELNSYLSLPSHSAARVRFKKKWLPEINNYSEMNGKTGHLLLRMYSDSKKMIPLRKIKIKDVKEIGDIVYIEFYLLEFPLFPSDETKFNELIDRIYMSLSSSFDVKNYPNNDNQDLINLIFNGSSLDTLVNKDDKSNYDEIKRWGVITSNFSRLNNGMEKVFKDFDFLKLVEIKSFDDKKIELEKSGNDYYFKLKPSTEYKTTFLQRTYTGNAGDSSIKGVRKIKITPETSLIKELRSGYIYGKYDLIHSSFSTSDYKKETCSNVEVAISKNASDHIEYPVILPMMLTTSLKDTVFTLLSFIIFLAGFILYYSAEAVLVDCTFLSAKGLKEILLPILILSGANIMKDLKDMALGRLSLL